MMMLKMTMMRMMCKTKLKRLAFTLRMMMKMNSCSWEDKVYEEGLAEKRRGAAEGEEMEEKGNEDATPNWNGQGSDDRCRGVGG